MRCLSEFKWVSCLIRLDQLWTAFAGVSTMEKALNEVAVLQAAGVGFESSCILTFLFFFFVVVSFWFFIKINIFSFPCWLLSLSFCFWPLTSASRGSTIHVFLVVLNYFVFKDRAVFTWLSKGIGFGFGFTTPFGWLVYLLWFWFYDSQVKTALLWCV